MDLFRLLNFYLALAVSALIATCVGEYAAVYAINLILTPLNPIELSKVISNFIAAMGSFMALAISSIYGGTWRFSFWAEPKGGFLFVLGHFGWFNAYSLWEVITQNPDHGGGAILLPIPVIWGTTFYVLGFKKVVRLSKPQIT